MYKIVSFGKKCNSKTSYLPRQSHDSLNTIDPAQGSYKLTSNEDSVIRNTSASYHNSSSNDVGSPTANCTNLPDILPVNIKMHPQQQQQQQQQSYNGNTNISVNAAPHTAPAILQTCYPTKAILNFQSSNASNNQQNSSFMMQNNHHGLYKATVAQQPQTITPSTQSPSALSSPSTTNVAISGSSNEAVSPKFMSQSAIDLKKTHIIKPNEIHTSEILLPVQLENNSSCSSNSPSSQSSQLPYSGRHDLKKTEIVRKLSLGDDSRNDDHLVRAELVNTTLSSSPSSGIKSDERIVRKESLRENIEKITQLQSKLMSAHLIEKSGERKLLSYTAKTIELTAKNNNEKEPIRKELKLSSKLETTSTSTQLLATKTESPVKSPVSSLELATRLPNVSRISVSSVSSPSPTFETNKISEMDNELDGLKLIQRTEIILRLNAPTSEAASQTDETLENDLSRIKKVENNGDKFSKNNESLDNVNILKPRQKLPEEIDCDNLSQDLVNQLPPNDKLCQILLSKSYKTFSDYIGDLYDQNVTLKLPQKNATTETITSVATKSSASTTTAITTTTPSITKRDVGTSTPGSDQSVGCELIIEPSTLLHNNNVINNNKNNNYNKNNNNNSNRHTEIMAVCSSESIDSNKKCGSQLQLQSQSHQQRIVRNVVIVNVGENNTVNGDRGENERKIENDSCDLIKKKEELVNRLTKKLQVLGNKQTEIGKDIIINEQLGNTITTKVTEKIRPIDATKFRAYIDDIGHITMLLLSLSGRLARIENTIHSINDNHNEKKILEIKRDRLLEQLDEAKQLKRDIDRRGQIVSQILEKHLTYDEFIEYDLFINTKTKLIVDSKEIADKIKLSEEQLSFLKDNLMMMQSDC